MEQIHQSLPILLNHLIPNKSFNSYNANTKKKIYTSKNNSRECSGKCMQSAIQQYPIVNEWRRRRTGVARNNRADNVRILGCLYGPAVDWAVESDIIQRDIYAWYQERWCLRNLLRQPKLVRRFLETQSALWDLWIYKSLRERGSLKKMSLERFLHKKKEKKVKDIFLKGKEENCLVGR